MSFEVPERLCYCGCPREEGGEHFPRHLLERECVTLSIQGVDDFVEAQEITDEWQILAVFCLIGMCKGSGHDVTEFTNVAHVRRWLSVL